MSTNDTDTLKALEQVLDLTDESDWHLIHDTVRKYVSEGKLSAAGEQAYKSMAEKKLNERDA